MRGRKRAALVTGLLVMFTGSVAAVADSGAPTAEAKSYVKLDKTIKSHTEISKGEKRVVKLDKSVKNFTNLSKDSI